MKRTLCLILSALLLLSTAVITASAAPATVTATVNGAPLASGGTISAISVVEFTLPNAITTSQLATAVTFEEETKGKSAAGWATRLYKGVVDGNTLTVTFAEGALAMNAQYRFTFKSPAVTGENQVFTFSTTASGPYYINDDFSRYPEYTLPVTSACTPTEVTAPWWLGNKRYGRIAIAFAKVNDNKTVLRLTSGATTNETDTYGAMSYDNAYAPVYSGTGHHKAVTEVSFTIAGNPSSVYEIEGLVIRTQGGQTGLYYRNSGLLDGNQSDVASKTTSLNYNITAPSDQPAAHTIKIIQSFDNTAPYKRRIHKVWFDGNPVTIPDAGIGVTLQYWASGQMEEGVINYGGGTGLGHVFSATNRFSRRYHRHSAENCNGYLFL